MSHVPHSCGCGGLTELLWLHVASQMVRWPLCPSAVASAAAWVPGRTSPPALTPSPFCRAVGHPGQFSAKPHAVYNWETLLPVCGRNEGCGDPSLTEGSE